MIRDAGFFSFLEENLKAMMRLAAAAHDKKTVDGRLTMILPEALGKVRAYTFTPVNCSQPGDKRWGVAGRKEN